MPIFNFPDPVSLFEAAKTAGFERDAANVFLSALFSAQITFLWRSGDSKWAQWIGEGKALQDAATAMYLSLAELQKKGFLTLTVPHDLLSADNLSKFLTQFKEK